MGALAYIKDPKYHGKIKHNIKYHFIKDIVASGEVTLEYISTNHMVANTMTKPIGRDLIVAHTKTLGLRRCNLCISCFFICLKLFTLYIIFEACLYTISYILKILV